MRLSKNFTLNELCYSSTALRLGIKNDPSKEGILKLTLLAAELLQPIRDRIGALRVTSGYRSPQLSEAIGSSSNSQHCRYEACDMQFVKRGKMDNLKSTTFPSILKFIAPSCGNLLSAISNLPIILKRVTTAP